MWRGPVPRDVAQILEPGERILWVEKPDRAAYVSLRFAPTVLIAVLFALFPLPALTLLWSTAPLEIGGLLLVFLAFWYGSLALVALGPPAAALLSHRNALYVLTDRRIIVRRGAVGVDYAVLELSRVTGVRVDVGLTDQVRGTGTVIVEAVGASPLVMMGVRDPLRAAELIRRASASARPREE